MKFDPAGSDDDLEMSDEIFEEAPDEAANVGCPYCGEVVELLLDPGGGDVQQYVEDCEVCCRPWQIEVRYDRHGTAAVSVQTAD